MAACGAVSPPPAGAVRGNWGRGSGTWTGSGPAEGVLGSVWFLCNRYTPYPNLYPDQSPSEDWTMEERFRPLTFHGLILRSQLVTLLVRGVCYSESQSVSRLSCPHQDSGRHEGGRSTFPAPAVQRCVWPRGPRCRQGPCAETEQGCESPSRASSRSLLTHC